MLYEIPCLCLSTTVSHFWRLSPRWPRWTSLSSADGSWHTTRGASSSCPPSAPGSNLFPSPGSPAGPSSRRWRWRVLLRLWVNVAGSWARTHKSQGSIHLPPQALSRMSRPRICGSTPCWRRQGRVWARSGRELSGSFSECQPFPEGATWSKERGTSRINKKKEACTSINKKKRVRIQNPSIPSILLKKKTIFLVIEILDRFKRLLYKWKPIFKLSNLQMTWLECLDSIICRTFISKSKVNTWMNEMYTKLETTIEPIAIYCTFNHECSSTSKIHLFINNKTEHLQVSNMILVTKLLKKKRLISVLYKYLEIKQTYFSLAAMTHSFSRPECFSTCMRASREEFL